MSFPYSKIKTNDKNHPYSELPLINVTISFGGRSITSRALIDSGADINLINAQFAKPLGFDYKTGVRTSLKGIVNQSIDVYKHVLELEIPRLTVKKVSMEFGFIDSSTVGILLGQKGFFDNFKITFEKYNNYFRIEEI
ncbi:MAG: retroviral-like aspartic protease [Ignavibacteria bacterium]|nr:retroviral-like aspartic protease [Ignavibacteria bacterium]